MVVERRRALLAAGCARWSGARRGLRNRPKARVITATITAASSCRRIIRRKNSARGQVVGGLVAASDLAGGQGTGTAWRRRAARRQVWWNPHGRDGHRSLFSWDLYSLKIKTPSAGASAMPKLTGVASRARGLFGDSASGDTGRAPSVQNRIREQASAPWKGPAAETRRAPLEATGPGDRLPPRPGNSVHRRCFTYQKMADANSDHFAF